MPAALARVRWPWVPVRARRRWGRRAEAKPTSGRGVTAAPSARFGAWPSRSCPDLPDPSPERVSQDEYKYIRPLDLSDCHHSLSFLLREPEGTKYMRSAQRLARYLRSGAASSAAWVRWHTEQPPFVRPKPSSSSTIVPGQEKIATIVIGSNRSAIVQRLANQQVQQICRVQPRTPPVKHPMAVGTDQGKVIDFCDVLFLHFRDGQCVVCFDETFANRAICLAEIEAAAVSIQSPVTVEPILLR